MESGNSLVHVFGTHSEAHEAVQSLAKSGFDLKKLSMVGKDYHSEEHPVGFYTAGDRIKTWGGMGALWGGIWGLLMAPAVFFLPGPLTQEILNGIRGLLMAPAVFFLPGLGLLEMAGPLVSALVGALEGAVVVGGVSALGAALSQVGVPRDQVIK